MPRSRRRTGVRNGKTQTQLAKALANGHRRRALAERIAKLKREAEERRVLADENKYANWPGNQ